MADAPACPVSALRTIRRAAHWSATFDELRASVLSAGEGMSALTLAWSDLRCALFAFEVQPDADRWQSLCAAVGALDVALAVFLGPSGWERPANA